MKWGDPEQHESPTGITVGGSQDSLQKPAVALVATLAETRSHGQRTEPRRQEEEAAKKYLHIKGLPARVAAGETLDPRHAAKLRSEAQVPKAMSDFWESQAVQTKEAVPRLTTAASSASAQPASGAPAGARMSPTSGERAVLPHTRAASFVRAMDTSSACLHPGVEHREKVGKHAPTHPARLTRHRPARLGPQASLRSHVGHSMRVCIAGDSGLLLNTSAGQDSFEGELKCELGPSVKLRRYPGEGASSISRCLRGQVGNSQIAVAVWLVNEAFYKRGLQPDYPQQLDDLADELIAVLSKFPYRAAIIGGTAAMWGVPEAFDAFAERIRARVRRFGILVLNGVEAYSPLEYADDDKWHAVSTLANKQHLACYYAKLARGLVT